MPEYDTPTSKLATQTKRGLLSKADKQKIDGVVPFLLPDGVVGAPGLAFALDTNTGLYRPAADVLGLVAGGVSVAEITNSALALNNNQLRLRDRADGNHYISYDLGVDGLKLVGFSGISLAPQNTERLRARLGATDGVTPGILISSDILVQRPGATNTGALFFGTAGAQHYLYDNGTDFIFGTLKVRSKNNAFFAEEHTPQWVSANAALTLTTTFTDLPGATLTLASIGSYLIVGTFDFSVTANDLLAVMVGVINVNGVDQTGQALFSAGTAGERATITIVASVTTTGVNQVAKLRANKTSGTGTSTANSGHSKIIAHRVVTN